MGAVIIYCGERFPVDPASGCTIGRDADVSLDDNRFLHRVFLEVFEASGFWWVKNAGTHLVATASTPDARIEQRLAPGGAVPLTTTSTTLRFTAGSTAYELEVDLDEAPAWSSAAISSADGATTLARVPLTPTQHLLIVALAEPMLRAPGGRGVSVPSSSEAAARLGWTLQRFNRSL